MVKFDFMKPRERIYSPGFKVVFEPNKGFRVNMTLRENFNWRVYLLKMKFIKEPMVILSMYSFAFINIGLLAYFLYRNFYPLPDDGFKVPYFDYHKSKNDPNLKWNPLFQMSEKIE